MSFSTPAPLPDLGLLQRRFEGGASYAFAAAPLVEWRGVWIILRFIGHPGCYRSSIELEVIYRVWVIYELPILRFERWTISSMKAAALCPVESPQLHLGLFVPRICARSLFLFLSLAGRIRKAEVGVGLDSYGLASPMRAVNSPLGGRPLGSTSAGAAAQRALRTESVGTNRC